jgi:hypothetical protein
MNFNTAVGITLFLASVSSVLQADVIETSNISTAPLNGSSGFFVIDFLGGDPIDGNTASISNFSSDWTLQGNTPSGGYSGDLVPGPLILNDSQFFNEWSQMVTFGSSASFVLDLTTNFTSGGIPDDLSIYLLDSTGNPYATTDPTGADSLLNIDVGQAVPAPMVYNSDFATLTLSPLANIPEPLPVFLLPLALLIIVWTRVISKNTP